MAGSGTQYTIVPLFAVFDQDGLDAWTGADFGQRAAWVNRAVLASFQPGGRIILDEKRVFLCKPDIAQHFVNDVNGGLDISLLLPPGSIRPPILAAR